MSAPSDLPDPRSLLITAASNFYTRGWMVGTAGNLSIRLPDDTIWITASGRSKGNLTVDDFVRIASDATVLERSRPDLKPSAETIIHQTLYQLFPTACACYHVHSIEANLVSRLTPTNALILPPLEMLKGFGIWDDPPHCVMPIFKNHSHVAQIAGDISDRFKVERPQVPALLIQDHGVTVWADSPASAQTYLEIAEYIFRYLVTARQIGL